MKVTMTIIRLLCLSLMALTGVICVNGSTSSVKAPMLGFPRESQATVALLVRDLATGEDIISRNADAMLVPASITKAITSASALKTLGPDYVFETPVYLSGRVKGHKLHGDIIIVGHGDPTMESRHFPTYRGFVDSVVTHLQRLGIDNVTGTVVTLDTMATPAQPQEWQVEDTPYTYGAGIYGLNWADNVFTLNASTGVTTPHVPDLVTVFKRRRGRGASVMRGVGSDSLVIYTSLPVSKRLTINTTTPHPDVVAAYALIQGLRDADIKIHEKAENPTEALFTDGLPLLYVHRSPPLSAILLSLMERSDNMMAEGVLRALCPEGDRYDCVDTEMRLWQREGLDIDQMHVTDGSGLSRSAHFSPAFLASLLQSMATDTTYVNLFPRTGIEGTVRNLLKNTHLEGGLALKSGSMNRVKTYAGYRLDINGQPTHVVVVMVNNFACSASTLRTAIEKFLLSTFNIYDTDNEPPA